MQDIAARFNNLSLADSVAMSNRASGTKAATSQRSSKVGLNLNTVNTKAQQLLGMNSARTNEPKSKKAKQTAKISPPRKSKQPTVLAKKNQKVQQQSQQVSRSSIGKKSIASLQPCQVGSKFSKQKESTNRLSQLTNNKNAANGKKTSPPPRPSNQGSESQARNNYLENCALVDDFSH